MALTAAQRDKVWQYLGYGMEPAVDYGLSAEINAKLALADADAVLANDITAILTALATVDAAILAAGSTSTSSAGGLKKVDEIEFYPVTTTTGTSSFTSGSGVNAVTFGRMMIRRLAQRLGSAFNNRARFRYDFIVADYFDLSEYRPPINFSVSSNPIRGW